MTTHPTRETAPEWEAHLLRKKAQYLGRVRAKDKAETLRRAFSDPAKASAFERYFESASGRTFANKRLR